MLQMSLESVTNPASGFDPYRNEHLKSEHWIHAGYDPNAVATYLAATEDGVKSNNAVLDIRIPNGGDTRCVSSNCCRCTHDASGLCVVAAPAQ
jgi:hypothetical protein